MFGEKPYLCPMSKYKIRVADNILRDNLEVAYFETRYCQNEGTFIPDGADRDRLLCS